MDTVATYVSETTWSRRCSTETILSLQDKETDFVQDSSDTELSSDADKDVEYEPVTESEQEVPISDDSSGPTDDEVRATGVAWDGAEGNGEELQLADSEAGSYVSDSELDLPAYWTCARCRSDNDNNCYRYCSKCYKLRKNFFPPRPRRKEKRSAATNEVVHILSQDSGVESHVSQEGKLSQDLGEGPSNNQATTDGLGKDRKRRANSAERTFKRSRLESESDVESKTCDVAPLSKTVSEPAVTIESLEAYKGYQTDSKDLCIICLSEPKTGVFVHRRVAHICCCYKCSVKVWSKARRCPICNCKVSNVLKVVVM